MRAAVSDQNECNIFKAFSESRCCFCTRRSERIVTFFSQHMNSCWHIFFLYIHWLDFDLSTHIQTTNLRLCTLITVLLCNITVQNTNTCICVFLFMYVCPFLLFLFVYVANLFQYAIILTGHPGNHCGRINVNKYAWVLALYTPTHTEWYLFGNYMINDRNTYML